MTIFEVSPDDIERLGDEDLRTLVGYLSEQELAARSLPVSAVTYGGNQNAKDGGIDVRVELDEGELSGFIPRPRTGFQVKAEDMPRAEILKEMRPGGELRPSIIELGKNGGCYVIVSSKGSTSDTALSSRRNAMAEALADQPDAAPLLVDFYDRRRIATWVNQHPGLIPWVRERIGKPLSGWQPFTDWSSSPGSIEEEYIPDAGVRLVGARLKEGDGVTVLEGINRVRAILGQAKGIVRLVGLSGVGKTRMVQALFDERVGENSLSPHLAVYADLADEPDPVPLELLGRLQDLKQRCILILDNCGVELHQRLARRLRPSNSLISLLTVEYDISDDEPEGTDVFKLEPASNDLIEKLLERKFPELSQPEVSTIAGFSEGNSRVAIALAGTARNGESLANLKDSELFKRLFGRENPELLRTAKACSLVYSFDGETDTQESEIALLANLVGQTTSDFLANVAELSRRKLIQKRSRWRALLPHALAHRLAKEILEEIPIQKISDAFESAPDERIAKSFSRRLGFLHDSTEAQAIASRWLGTGGWLAEAENLNAFGVILFDNIAPINPEASLRSIEEAFARAAPESFKSAPWVKLIQVLRSLAYEPTLFERAAQLVAQLAEPADDSNNMADAVNVFDSLFHLYLSGTHATAIQRTDLLRKLAHSGDSTKERLALRGLREMMKSSHFTGFYTFEFGARKRDYGFYPRTVDDLRNWFGAVLGLIKEFDGVPALSKSTRAIVATQFGELTHTTMIDELIALAAHFQENGGWPEGFAGVRAAIKLARLHDSDTKQKLGKLAARLKPESLSDRITSYAIPEEWSRLDVLDEQADDPDRFQKAHAAVVEKCREIGSELAADHAALELHLPELLDSKSGRIRFVAESLAQAVDNPEAAWGMAIKLIGTAENRGRYSNFFSGFIGGLAKRDLDLTNRVLDDALSKSELRDHFVVMQVSAGLDKQGCKRLIAATSIDAIPSNTFFTLGTGRACDGLPSPDFCEIVRAISQRPDGLLIAIDILSMRFHTAEADKAVVHEEESALGRELLMKLNFSERRVNGHHWIAGVAKSSMRAGIDDAAADTICQNLLEATKDYRANVGDFAELVDVIASRFPFSVLNILVERNNSPYEGRGGIFRIFRDERSCPLDQISDDDLLAWAIERAEERFLYLAECVSYSQKADGTKVSEDDRGEIEWTPTAIKIIEAAPAPEKVAQIFARRFHPSGWSGSLAAILASRTPLLQQLDGHQNQEIATWAKKAQQDLRELVEKVRASEEREDRERDERFEW